jgi:hypothetical protein
MSEKCLECGGEGWYYASYADQMDYKLTRCMTCNSGLYCSKNHLYRPGMGCLCPVCGEKWQQPLTDRRRG